MLYAMPSPLQNPECAFYLSYLLWIVILLSAARILSSAKGLALIIPLCIALVAFSTSPWMASDLSIVPDSVEYVSGAINSIAQGSYSITVDGVSHPPRYSPWFSLLLMPAYSLFGTEAGNGIFVVLIFAVLGVIAAWSIGREVSGVLGAVLSLLVLLVATEYPLFSKQIMGDLPAAALLMLAAYGFLVMRRDGLYVLALPIGIVCGVAVALRPLMALALLPVGIHLLRNGLWLRLLLCILPSVAVISATLLYNQSVFGDIFRTGYNYWTAIPYDYPKLVWSVDYVTTNLGVVWRYTSIPALIVLSLLAFYWVRNNRSARTDHSLLAFVIPITIALIASHLVYFFGSSRFYLGVTSLLSVTLGSYAGHFFQSLEGRGLKVKPLLIVVTVLLAAMLQFTLRREPIRREAAERLREHTPARSIIISGIDSAYLSLLVPDRRFIPISRRVEYASKVITLGSIADRFPAPSSWREHRADGVLEAGAIEAVAFTALDDVTKLKDLVSSGQVLFVDGSSISAQELDFLRANFRLSSKTDLLFQITLKEEPLLSAN